jgi:hypothetical protein
MEIYSHPALTRAYIEQAYAERETARLKMRACIDCIRATQIIYMEQYVVEEAATADLDALLGEYNEELQVES